MAETLEQLIVDINADTTGFENGLDRVQRGTDGFGSGLSKLGKLVTGAFAFKKVVDFGIATTNLASDADELQNKFSVVFDGITDDTEDWIKVYAQSTARGIQSTKDFLTSLQDIQTGYGRTVDEAAAFSKTVVGVTNDLVSFSNVPVEQASNAIQSALAGNLEAVRSLGVSINVATIDNGEYAASIGKSWKEMTILEKQNATLNEILAQSRNAVGQNVDSWRDYDFTLGDAAKTSGGFANQTKLLQGRLVDVGAEFGKRLLPVANSVVTFFNENLVPATDFLINGFDKVISILFDTGKEFTNFTGILNIDFKTILEIFNIFVVKTKAFLTEYFLFFKDIFIQIFEVVSNILTDVTSFIIKFIDENKESIITFLESILEFFSTQLELVKTIVTVILTAIRAFWELWGEDILKIVGFIFKTLITLFTNVFNVFSDLFNIFKALFTGDWELFWDSIASLFSNILDNIKDLFSLLFEGVKIILDVILKLIITNMEIALKGVLNLAKSFFDAGKNLMLGLKDGILSVASNIANAAKDAVKGAVDGVKDFLGIKSPSRLMMGIGDNFSEGMAKGIINNKSPMRAIEGLNNMINAAINPLKADIGISNNGNGSNGNGFNGTQTNREQVIQIFNNNNPNPSDIARQIRKQEQAFALNFN